MFSAISEPLARFHAAARRLLPGLELNQLRPGGSGIRARRPHARKYEAVYLHELADGFAAEQVISEWMTFYSDVRPHSALGGRTPAEAYREERAA